MSACLEAALAAHAAGLCVLPPAEDGTKRPFRRWQDYQHTRPTDDDVLGWYANGRTGLGVVCGAVSGGLEMLELEGRAVDAGLPAELRRLATDAGMGDLLDRIQAGYVERTPSGGLHLLYRVPTPRGNTRLARRPATAQELEQDPQDRIKVLVETRGEGGYVVTAPSSGEVHPSGRPWELLAGGFPTIATITDEERDELWSLARTLDRMPVGPPRKAAGGRSAPRDGEGPIDRYNAAHGEPEMEALLVAHGWSVVFRRDGTTYLRRPGKDRGISATLGHHPGTFICFSSSTPFEQTTPDDPHGYDAAGVLAVLEHGGDMVAMGKALADAERIRVDLGPKPPGPTYGSPPVEPEPDRDDPGPSEGPEDGRADELLTIHGVRALGDIPADPPPPLLIERIHPTGHTILYGDGDTGKGVLASWWIVQLTRAGHRVLIVDYEDHPDEWSARIRSLGGGLDAVPMVHHVSPLTKDWTPQHGPLWVVAPTIRAIADRVGATVVVVDSIVPACYGYDSLKPEVPGLYAMGVQSIGLPVVSLAHATKSGEDRWPFGSVFWHNLARVTWSARKVGGGGHQVLLKNRKHNQSEGHGRVLAVVTWKDGLPCEVDEKPYAVRLAEAIRDLFADQEELLSAVQVTDRLNEELDEDDPPVKVNSVRVALRRGLAGDGRKFRVEGVGKDARWGLAA